jgi:nucleotide-binding universal stress UspA family protein
VKRDIIVPLDGSQTADAAIPHAAELAKTTGGNVHLLRVHVPVLAYAAAESPIAIPDPAWDERVREAAKSWLVRQAADVRVRIGLPVTFELRIGSPAEQVVEAARERDAYAIVCTTHGHGGWAPQWLGSVTDGIIRHSPCPVLAMSEQAVMRTPRVNRILVPLDGGHTASTIIPIVQEMALKFDAIVDLYRVVAPPWVGDAINAVQSGRIDPFGVDPAADHAKHEIERVAQEMIYHGVRATSTVEVATNPTRAILERIALTDPDMLAITTHGRGFSRLFMGSVADKLLRAGGRPALCWRPPHNAAEPDSAQMFATAASGATA